jgi:serine/threonine-protein kinase
VTKGKVCPQCGTKYDAEHRFCTRDGATLVAENPNESLIGSILADRYHVLEKLGEGGMGEVYLAEHVRIKRKVAVKVMRRWMSADAVALGRFHREAENASQISHTNVATIYDFGETGDGMVYFAMEYVDGEPLSEIIKREQRVGIIRACDIIRQVADALAAAHALGILHRDLKPDNVMIGKTRVGTDQVKIVDFGISRVMDRGTQQFTSTGMVIGTPDYMSPEQLSGDTVDARTDNYALALIAFRLLTGSSAFAGSNAQESLLARLTKPAQRLATAYPALPWPEAIQLVFDRALNVDPETRYLESLEFAAALEVAAADASLSAEDEKYLQLLKQRNLTPPRGYGTIDAATPAFGAPTIGGGLTVPRSRLWNETPPDPASGTRDEPAGEEGETRQASDEGTTAMPAAATGDASLTEAGVPVRQRRSVGRMAIAGVAGLVALWVIARSVRSSSEAPATTVATVEEKVPPSAPAPDSQPAVTPVITDSASPSATVLRSDAVVSRLSRSVFAVSSAAGHGAGFLADSSGLVVTSASLVPADNMVTIQLDGARRYRARVLLAERGIAIAALPPRACRGCPVLLLSADSNAVALGDSVVAIGSAESSGRVRRGVVKASTTQRVAASFDIGSRHAGAPVLALTGTIVAIASRGTAGAVALTPAASVMQTLVRARQSRSGVTSDTTPLPVWPVKRIAEAERSRGLSLTDRDIDAYRIRRDGFEVLVMTPQVMAWRRTLISRPSSSPDNPFAVTASGDKVSGTLKDPVQRWSEWDEYWRERRAVVIIDVSPEATRPPFHGSAKPVEFKKGDVESMELTRDGAVLPAIEASRFAAVPDPEGYTGRAIFHSGVAVFVPAAFATGARFRLDVRDASRQGKTITIDIPTRAIDRIRIDLAAFLER